MDLKEQIELVSLRRRKGVYVVKKGVCMDKMKYNIIVRYILSCLHAREEKEVSLNELIDLASESLSQNIKGNLWYLLQVKQDLEARRIIKKFINHKNEQVVRLSKRSVYRFR